MTDLSVADIGVADSEQSTVDTVARPQNHLQASVFQQDNYNIFHKAWITIGLWRVKCRDPNAMKTIHFGNIKK